MPILVTREQLTLEKLAEGLLTSRASRTQITETVEALRRANPGLDVRRLAAGTPVVVPPLRNARVDFSAVGRRVGEDLTDPAGAVEQLEPFAAANRDLVARRAEDFRNELAGLGRGRQAPVPAEMARAIADALQQDLEGAEQLVTVWSDAAPGWQKRIAELQERALGTERD